jgi:hypothetical protein
MALHEIEHPLGIDLETIHTAVSMGFIKEMVAQEPDLKVDYKDPLELGYKIAEIRIADWRNENITGIYYPFAVEPDDTDWQIKTDDEFLPVRQRVHTRDLLGRGFPLTMGEDSFVSPYLQFDVIDEGIVLSGEDRGEKKLGLGRFEGNTYDTMDLLARHQSSILAILRLAEAA